MSVKELVEAKCPSCSEEAQVTAWRSINTVQDPDAKDLLLAGDVNVFRCRRCGYESLIDIDLLYHDAEKRFCVQYYPYERLSDDNFLSHFTTAGEPLIEVPDGVRLKPELVYMIRPHIVFELGELVRYVAFRDRLAELEEETGGGQQP